MNWLSILTTIFDIAWLASVLLLLWLIWRSSTRHIHKMETTLVSVAMKDAESVRRALDDIHELVALLKEPKK